MKTFTADDFVPLNDSPFRTTVSSIKESFDGVAADAAASTLLELRRE